MSSPVDLPDLAAVTPGRRPDGLWHDSFRAMASHVRVLIDAAVTDPGDRFAEVRDVFRAVERDCTRFDPTSELMRANAAADDWQVVGPWCFAALYAAREAHRMTGGLFDPRTLRTLTGLGYATTFAAIDPDAPAAGHDVLSEQAPATSPWEPSFDEERSAVRIGPEPVELGGIGKGLALRWAADRLLRGGTEHFLLDAGGDCVAVGSGPDGDGWSVGVEDPCGGALPLAVLSVADRAVATSSTRVRHWRHAGREVHHLIDPRTGTPGGEGLLAVTVVGDDPAEAEVWTKLLFLHGHDIAAAAERHQLAALWVDADGRLEATPAARGFVTWTRG